jgi:tetratricopeptide (TPR) repeat protein
MPDRLRTDPTHAPDGLSPGDRDTRIEELLLAGLDDYFAGEYERAITAWTRVLFIDRGHPRAKAYIDRARSAVAERQRESEELLHRGVAAFNRGETERARTLLTSVLERGGPQEVALAFLERLAHLERPGQAPDTAAEPRARRRLRRPRHEAALKPGRRRAAWWLPIAALALILVAAFYVQDSRERTAPFLFLTTDRREPPAATRAAEEPLPVPRSAELELAQARRLLASGHARDALRLVEGVRRVDPLRPEADALREAIQRVLLSDGAAATHPGAAPASPVLPATRAQ